MPAGKPSFCWLHVYQVKVKLSKRSDSRAADALFVSKYNSKSILSGCHLCLSGALPPFFLLPSFPLSPPSLSLCLISFWTDSHFCRQTHTSTQREWTKKSKSLALSSRGLFSLFFLRHNFHFFPLTWLHSPLRTSFFPPSPSPPPSLTPSTYLFVCCSVVAVFSFAV